MNETFRQRVLDDLTNTLFEFSSPDDVPELVELCGRFFAESDYGSRGIVYDSEKAAGWIRRVTEFGSVPHFVARLDGRIIGFCSYIIDDTFSVRPVAVLHVLYVVPEHRRSAIGRMLLGLVAEAAHDVDDCCAFHAPVASGIHDAVSLQNMLTKAGFNPIGFIMGRAL